jgi:hypothetical protein
MPLGSFRIFKKFAEVFPARGLPPVSMTPVSNAKKLQSKMFFFAAGVVVTGGKLPPVSLIPAANLPPVSLIPVVHLYLRIFPRIFKKIQNGPNGILWGWGETDS